MTRRIIVVSDYYNTGYYNSETKGMIMAIAKTFYQKDAYVKVLLKSQVKEYCKKCKGFFEYTCITSENWSKDLDSITSHLRTGLIPHFRNMLDFVHSMWKQHEEDKIKISDKLFRLLEQTAIKIENRAAMYCKYDNPLGYFRELSDELTKD